MILYHNPKCSKSQEAKALLEERGLRPQVIEYLETPPSAAELDGILKKLGMEPRQLLRTKDPAYAEPGLADPRLTRAQLIEAMVSHSILGLLSGLPPDHGNLFAAADRARVTKALATVSGVMAGEHRV